MKHIISLGAGVQSSTMALMAALGEITPMPDGAIFADTRNEPARVYEWLAWLETQLPFPVYRVSQGNLMEQALRIRRSKKSGNTYLAIGLPVYLSTNGKKGMGMRQCTRTFKIDPIRREMRRLRSGQPVTQWIGISLDEAHRMKDARDAWCTNRWPLVDLRISREDCLRWMKAHDFPEPPRSACVYCPYHDDKQWRALTPAEFSAAVDFELTLQSRYREATALNQGAVPYLHASRLPLSDVDLRDGDHQVNMFGNECEGMCGV